MFVFESIFMQCLTDFMSFQCFPCYNYRDSKGQDLCLYLTQAVSIGRGWWLKETRKLKTQQDEIKNYFCCHSTKLRNILISLSYFNSHFPNIIQHWLCQFDVPKCVLSLAIFSSGVCSLFWNLGEMDLQRNHLGPLLGGNDIDLHVCTFVTLIHSEGVFWGQRILVTISIMMLYMA